jgi:hypothetical protein
MLTSLKLRKDGNEILQSILENMPFAIKEMRLHQSLGLYRHSARESQTRQELSSALKNVSVVTSRLFSLYVAEKRKKVAIFYAKETQIESIKAYEAGNYPNAQSREWLAQLKLKQSEAAKAYLDFLCSIEINLEEKVDFLLELKNISADHVKCWLNYQIAEVYYKSSLTQRDVDLKASYRSINEANYYFEECLKLHRHSAPLFEIRIEEFASDLAVQFCIVESIKYKQTADKNIDHILNDSEHLNIEALWDNIDLYHEAICKSKNKHIELEAEVLSLLGTLFAKVLKIKERASKCYQDCFHLTEALKPKLFTNYKWFKTCVKAIEDSQKENVKEETKKLDAEMEKVKDKIG